MWVKAILADTSVVVGHGFSATIERVSPGKLQPILSLPPYQGGGTPTPSHTRHQTCPGVPRGARAGTQVRLARPVPNVPWCAPRSSRRYPSAPRTPGTKRALACPAELHNVAQAIRLRPVTNRTRANITCVLYFLLASGLRIVPSGTLERSMAESHEHRT